MRIQHNIAALNSHRQLGTNQSNSAKNLEKLSSGFRINRAGDDAAGLAISEKMRGQIRGLDMASKNAQDGISLIQTAEGALNETHSILQRMRELSVQSANGTYQDEVDRENLNKEVEALKSEIDRIATSTHFNKIQLLDGSIGSGSKVTSKDALAPTTSVSSSKPVAGGANATALGDTGAGTTVGTATNRIDGTNAKYQLAFATTNSGGAAGGSGSSTASVTFKYTDADAIDREKTLTFTVKDGMSADDIATAFKTAFEKDTTLNKLFNVAASTGGNAFVFEAKGALGEDASVTLSDITVDTATASISGTAACVADGVDAVAANQTLDLANAKAGDTIKIGDTTFELVEEGGKAAKGNIAVAYDKLNQTNTTRNLWEKINEQNVDGIAGAIVRDDTIELKGTGAKMPTIEVDTTARAAIGVTTSKLEGTEHNQGGNGALRGWHFTDATSTGTIQVNLNKADGTAIGSYDVSITNGMTGKDIAEKIANEINTADEFRDDDGNALYTATVRESDGALIVTANNAVATSLDMTAGMIDNKAAGGTKAVIKSDDVIEAQAGKVHDAGGTGGSTTIDFSKAQVGDLFSINGQTYEIVEQGKEVLTSGARALEYNANKEEMVKDLMSKTGSRYDDTDAFKMSQDGSKLTITNQTVGESSTVPEVKLGSVGTNAKIEVGGVTVDFGKSNALNGYNINVTTGESNKAEIDSDKKAINIQLKEGATANDLKAALKNALAASNDDDLKALEVKVSGELKVGTDGQNASSEITFKENLKTGDTVTIGDKTYQIGKAGDEVKAGNVLLEMEADSNGNVTGEAVAQALAAMDSEKYTATVDGNKLTLVAADDAKAEDIKVTVNDSKALTFQIGANGTADQRVSLNVEDMSSAGIGVEGINVLTADDANAAIDIVDQAINMVSSTRADLGALQNRLEHTVNNLGTTSENLTAAESRIRDVDMAKEMMEFTKNNILTQAAQAMLAQANQQPQGVLQLLQ